ncbi:MAG: YHS domain-containing (seleno)protein [Bacteroidota bacterium]
MRLSALLILPLLLLLNTSLLGQDLNLAKGGVAIQGYDPVSYFENGPERGSPTISAKFNGAIYYFTSDLHKKEFEANPEKYVPSYGGYCAYAIAIDGSKVKIDPETYKIQDGELLLFYNFRRNNTLKPWEEKPEELKTEADKNWQKNAK